MEPKQQEPVVQENEPPIAEARKPQLQEPVAEKNKPQKAPKRIAIGPGDHQILKLIYDYRLLRSSESKP